MDSGMMINGRANEETDELSVTDGFNLIPAYPRTPILSTECANAGGWTVDHERIGEPIWCGLL